MIYCSFEFAMGPPLSFFETMPGGENWVKLPQERGSSQLYKANYLFNEVCDRMGLSGEESPYPSGIQGRRERIFFPEHHKGGKRLPKSIHLYSVQFFHCFYTHPIHIICCLNAGCMQHNLVKDHSHGQVVPIK